TFGIGTESNNAPGSVLTYHADSQGNFTTSFDSQSLTESFIDSGSNGLFFPAPTGLSTCSGSSNAPGWFCPTSTQNYSATNTSATGSPSGAISFQIVNTSNIITNGNSVFNDVGADSSTTGFSTAFDWGLPFFLGRKVYVGING